MALDTGELADRHRWSFAGGLTFTDRRIRPSWTASGPAGRQLDQVEVEIRPLSRYWVAVLWARRQLW